MGAKDIHIKQWLGVEARFADLFNVLLFQGREVLTPDKLKKIDGESGVVCRTAVGATVNVSRYRDILMQADVYGRTILLALENQQTVHYGMPARTILYDTMNYSNQIKVRAKYNRAKRHLKTDGEYLSGLKKTDWLIPVITFVLYYGDQEWDGCEDIHTLLGVKGIYGNLETYIPNYEINLLDVRTLAARGNYKTDLKYVFGMLQYKDDSDKIKGYIKEHAEFFNSVDEDTFDVLKVLLGAAKILEEPEVERGKVNMCKALEDIYLEGKAEGKSEAILELLQEYGEVPEEIQRRITAESNLEILKAWLKSAARAGSIDAFTSALTGSVH